MTRQAITVELPEEVYEHVKRAAEGMKRPLGRALASIVKAAPSLEKVPVQYRSELESMETLDNEELWKIAERRLSAERQRRLERLLLESKHSGLTEREQQSLARLRNEADRLTLRKSYACLLLKYRGQHIPELPEFA